MRIPAHARRAGILAAALAAATSSSCDSPSAVHVHDVQPVAADAMASAKLTPLLKQLRRETARYNSTTQAQRAGYLPTDECVAIPNGPGMGFHWANPNLTDPVFVPLQPEVVLYEAGANGQLRLVAVEYVVIDIGQPPPTFGGQPFDVGGVPPLTADGIDHWSLHVWLYKDNPAGMFTPFNPNVSCP